VAADWSGVVAPAALRGMRSSAGWTAQMGERWRGLSVAPLASAPRGALR